MASLLSFKASPSHLQEPFFFFFVCNRFQLRGVSVLAFLTQSPKQRNDAAFWWGQGSVMIRLVSAIKLDIQLSLYLISS